MRDAASSRISRASMLPNLLTTQKKIVDFVCSCRAKERVRAPDESERDRMRDDARGPDEGSKSGTA